MASSSKQRLALAICDFLTTSTTDGTLSAEDKDSIDVAINCIAESFKVDPADSSAVSEAIGSQNLLQIYSVYEKLKNSSKPAASTSAPAGAAAAADAAPSSSAAPSEEDKKSAEDLKGQGNRAMASKDYQKAIDLYSQALALHPGNAIFLSNRAAAYSAIKDHESARADAEAAVALDPKYTKGWSRLGLALFALGDPKGSMEAYRQGIEHEGNGGSEAMRKGFETAKRRMEDEDSAAADAASAATETARGAAGAGAGGMPDLSSLAGMFGGGGAGGAGGAGGMPDFGSMMSNPMFQQMAQNIMSNPDMMSNLMSNPRLREMADRYTGGGGAGGGAGGGMPDLSNLSGLMNDPNIAEMARNLMGGGAGGNPGAGRGAGSGGQ